MPSPFSGMNPYLEDPAVFPDLHDSLVFCLRESLNANLPPPYYAGIASRVWIESSVRSVGPDVKVLTPTPDGDGESARSSGAGGVAVAEALAAEPIVINVPHEEQRERFLEIYTQSGGERLVTTIEVLSMTTKTPGEHGRDLYLKKQKEILESKVHLVEIDLLRGGRPTTAVPRALVEAKVGPFAYHVSIHHFDKPEDFYVYARRLEMRLPAIAVPLLPGDGSVTVDLQVLLDKCYDTGHYERRVRYKENPPVPPLSPEQMEWAQQVLRGKGLL